MNATTQASKNRTVTIVDLTQSKKGNFTAYTTAGERFFISQKKAEKLNLEVGENFKPFYALVNGAKYNRLVNELDITTEGGLYFGKTDMLGKPYINAEGEQESFVREEAVAIFATRQEAVEAGAQAELVDLERADLINGAKAKMLINRQIELKKSAEEAGLSYDDVKEMAKFSFD